MVLPHEISTECVNLVDVGVVYCIFQCFDYPGYFRIVLTVPEEKMIEACCRMEEFCKTNYVS